MCAAKNKLTRFELRWHFILPHINIWLSPERRHLKLYLFLIWWAKLDCKNKHTWSICIIPLAEIHLHWIMTMTKTNEWDLPPYLCPILCSVWLATHISYKSVTIFLELKHKFLFPALVHSAVVTIKGIDMLYWYILYFRVRDYDRCVPEKERMSTIKWQS